MILLGYGFCTESLIHRMNVIYSAVDRKISDLFVEYDINLRSSVNDICRAVYTNFFLGVFLI